MGLTHIAWSLERMLDELTEEERELLAMIFSEHLSCAEIARLLAIPETAVRKRVADCVGRIVARRRSINPR